MISYAAVNSITTRYYDDGDDVILEKTGSTSIYYIHGPQVDEIISDSRGYCYHYDGLGSVSNVTDNSGVHAATYNYKAFGVIRSQSGSISSQWGFTGRQYDAESGFYYYRNRYYDPRTGRFITRDPIGTRGGINLYAYCSNDPVNFVDPWGLCSEKVWWQKLEEGEYYGTGFGQSAAEWYAQQQLQTGNPLWAISGSVASLWTSETYQATGWTLVTAGSFSGWASSTGMKVGLHPAHHTFRIFGKDVALKHIQITLWEIAKKGSHKIFRIPLPR